MRRLEKTEDILTYYKGDKGSYRIPACPKNLTFEIINNTYIIKYTLSNVVMSYENKLKTIDVTLSNPINDIKAKRNNNEIIFVLSEEKKITIDKLFNQVNNVIHVLYDEALVHIMPSSEELYTWAEIIIKDV